jgi:hypothetical protein
MRTQTVATAPIKRGHVAGSMSAACRAICRSAAETETIGQAASGVCRAGYAFGPLVHQPESTLIVDQDQIGALEPSLAAGLAQDMGIPAMTTGGNKRCAGPQSVSSGAVAKSASIDAGNRVSDGVPMLSTSSFAVRASDSRARLEPSPDSLAITPRTAAAASK